jgi:hypothetical protein
MVRILRNPARMKVYSGPGKRLTRAICKKAADMGGLRKDL